MPLLSRPRFSWRLRSATLPLGRRTVLMGIVNVTPDSFSDGNRYFKRDEAAAHALRLLDEGADLIDIGGESTRPDANPVAADEEQERVVPVLKAIVKARPQAVLSVDTYHASTAQRAIELGAEIVNDVSGLLWDRQMGPVLAREQPGAVLMHTRGAPKTWGTLPKLPHADILPLVVSGLAHTLTLARAAGIKRESIVLDPGFGFGKLGDENFTLLAHFAELQQFGLPLLAGVSRKRFLTAHLHARSDSTRMQATTAANVAAILAGAHVLRVHDVAAARASASVADAILSSREPVDSKAHPAGVKEIQSSQPPA